MHIAELPPSPAQVAQRRAEAEPALHNIAMGQLTNTVSVMVKALAGGRVDAYWCLVPRDRPEPPNGPR